MCKTQRQPAWIVLALLAACSGRSRGANDFSLPGDRGGAWPGGIGAVLRYNERERVLAIHRCPPEGAAARAGVREGDVIVAIDGAAVSGLSRHDVVARLRGEVGTTVTLRVRRDGAERDLRVERAPYQRPE